MINALLEKYGDKQMIIAIEELAELQKEISKKLRGNGDNNHLCEEIADVMFCLEQIIAYYDLSVETINAFREFKKERTRERYLKD